MFFQTLLLILLCTNSFFATPAKQDMYQETLREIETLHKEILTNLLAECHWKIFARTSLNATFWDYDNELNAKIQEEKSRFESDQNLLHIQLNTCDQASYERSCKIVKKRNATYAKISQDELARAKQDYDDQVEDIKKHNLRVEKIQWFVERALICGAVTALAYGIKCLVKKYKKKKACGEKNANSEAQIQQSELRTSLT